jgi:hypothetical protein
MLEHEIEIPRLADQRNKVRRQVSLRQTPPSVPGWMRQSLPPKLL